MDSGYDQAQICLTGHTINSSYTVFPQHNKKYCDLCGAKTIIECPNCRQPIRGWYKDGSPFQEYAPPKFCHNCGGIFPWTKATIEAAKELVDDLEELTAEEKESYKESIDELVKESPKQELAAGRVKGYLMKAGPKIYQEFKDITAKVLSEIIKDQFL